MDCHGRLFCNCSGYVDCGMNDKGLGSRTQTGKIQIISYIEGYIKVIEVIA